MIPYIIEYLKTFEKDPTATITIGCDCTNA
jgi:hypothetical protein